jgi:hypothetical protein
MKSKRENLNRKINHIDHSENIIIIKIVKI